MDREMIDRIKNDPDYIELVKNRGRFTKIMSVIMLAIYFGFVLTIAFDPEILGTPLLNGSVTTIGIPVGIGVIFSAFILTGIYVRKANNEYDPIVEKIKQKAKGEA